MKNIPSKTEGDTIDFKKSQTGYYQTHHHPYPNPSIFSGNNTNVSILLS
jgi:hypothetical protein